MECQVINRGIQQVFYCIHMILKTQAIDAKHKNNQLGMKNKNKEISLFTDIGALKKIPFACFFRVTSLQNSDLLNFYLNLTTQKALLCVFLHGLDELTL